MPSFSTTILLALTAFVALAGGYIFLFGLPPQLKRELEEKALETMGENKMSYGLQQGLGKIPDSDSKVSRDSLWRKSSL